MAKAPVMEFTRGTEVTYTLQVPIGSYIVGSILAFTAKPVIDNDALNLKAVINKEFNDTNVTLDSVYATYTMDFIPADIVNVSYANGSSENDYLGQFKYMNPGQAPTAFPYNNQYIKVRIYGDVKLGGN